MPPGAVSGRASGSPSFSEIGPTDSKTTARRAFSQGGSTGARQSAPASASDRCCPGAEHRRRAGVPHLSQRERRRPVFLAGGDKASQQQDIKAASTQAGRETGSDCSVVPVHGKGGREDDEAPSIVLASEKIKHLMRDGASGRLTASTVPSNVPLLARLRWKRKPSTRHKPIGLFNELRAFFAPASKWTSEEGCSPPWLSVSSHRQA